MKELPQAVSNANTVIESSGYQLVHTDDSSLMCMQRVNEFNNEPVLFPICLNNGYYNKEKISLMMRFLPSFTGKVIIFFTDGPAQNNYLALGKTQVEAEREARLQRNRLYNHCVEGLSEVSNLTYSFDEWKEIYNSEEYKRSFDEIRELYKHNQEFSQEVLSGTDHVLKRIASHHGLDTQSINTEVAVNYVLQELAYILSVPERHNLDKVTYIYYDRWPVLEKLLDGQYDGKIRDHIAYLMLTLKKLESDTAKVTPDQIVSQFNTWFFKREQPSDLGLLNKTVETAISNQHPIHFILYWGKGDRNQTGEIEQKTLVFLNQIRTRIESFYLPGVQFTIIFTDTHAELNGYLKEEAQQYFQSMEQLAEMHSFQFNYLSHFAPFNKESLKVESLPKDLEVRLVDMASRHYRNGKDFHYAARLYYTQNQIEKVKVEETYPHSIFLTFNSSELNKLFPEKLPIFYAYSYEKGTSVKPWFVN